MIPETKDGLLACGLVVVPLAILFGMVGYAVNSATLAEAEEMSKSALVNHIRERCAALGAPEHEIWKCASEFQNAGRTGHGMALKIGPIIAW